MPEGRRFRKGESGNPGGRPKRKPLTEALIAELEACVHGTETTRMQEIIQRLVQMAAAGDLGAIKHIWAYVEGLPTQKVDIRSEVERLAEQYGKDPDELYERTLRAIEGMKR